MSHEDNLKYLNVSDTNITDLDMVKNLENLSYLDLRNNNISEILKVYDYYKNNEYGMYIVLSDETTDYDIDVEYLEKESSNNYIYIGGIDYIKVNLNNEEFNSYIKDKWDLRHKLMQLLGESYGTVAVKNGKIDKKINNITFDNENEPLELKMQYNTGFKIYK